MRIKKIKNIIEFYVRKTKIMKILKYNQRINKIKEVIQFNARTFETHENYRIALENYVNQ